MFARHFFHDSRQFVKGNPVYFQCATCKTHGTHTDSSSRVRLSLSPALIPRPPCRFPGRNPANSPPDPDRTRLRCKPRSGPQTRADTYTESTDADPVVSRHQHTCWRAHVYLCGSRPLMRLRMGKWRPIIGYYLGVLCRKPRRFAFRPAAERGHYVNAGLTAECEGQRATVVRELDERFGFGSFYDFFH